MTEPRTLSALFRALAAHPWEMLGRRWNYKAAVLSAVVRGALFFTANSAAGFDAASTAATTEIIFRLVTSGFYGALTQSFRRVEPAATATLAALLLLPVASHSLEFIVHWSRGTPALAVSVSASVAFTGLSTSFNLFAMRQGALIVGDGRRSFLQDLAAIPGLVVLFVSGAVRSFARACL